LDYYVLKMRTQAYESILKGHVTIPVSHVKKELAFNTEKECISFLKDQKARIDNILNEHDKIESIIDCKASLSNTSPIVPSSALPSFSQKFTIGTITSKKGSNKSEKKKLKNGDNMKVKIEKSFISNRNDIDYDVDSQSATSSYSDVIVGYSSSSSKIRNSNGTNTSDVSHIVSANGFTSKSHTKVKDNNTVTSSFIPSNDNKKVKIDRGPIINANIDQPSNSNSHNRKRKKSENNSDNNSKSKKKNRGR
jgi:hypothetical protein